MPFQRDGFFNSVRAKPFGGKLSQEQVDGMGSLLDVWEEDYEADNNDLRWLAYALATAKHETASTMMPIEEYGFGEGQPYGEVDPETNCAYYGRGYIQITWRENYAKLDKQLGLSGEDSCEWNAENALDPEIAADALYEGLIEGWYRSSDGTPNNLAKYFNDTRDDPYGAREAVNGDKHIVPSWSNGVSIGNLIKGYHNDFLAALHAAYVEVPIPAPIEPPLIQTATFRVVVTGPGPFTVTVEEDTGLPF
jgi:hypothetical protein